MANFGTFLTRRGSQSSEEVVDSDSDVVEVIEDHHLEVLPTHEQLEVVPRITIEVLESLEEIVPEEHEVEVRRGNVEKVVHFSDDNDVDIIDANLVGRKSLTTVDIANEIMRVIGSKVNFDNDGTILTNDSDGNSSGDEDGVVGSSPGPDHAKFEDDDAGDEDSDPDAETSGIEHEHHAPAEVPAVVHETDSSSDSESEKEIPTIRAEPELKAGTENSGSHHDAESESSGSNPPLID